MMTRSTMVPRRYPLVLCIWTLLFLFIVAGSSTSPTASSEIGSEGNKLPLHGITPDKFVQAAPLMVAAACRDGIVILAAHTPADDEPLLYHCYSSENQEEDIVSSKGEPSSLFQDLPAKYGGPFRIQPVDAFGTALVCTGWRADCENLVSRCRTLATSEVNRFGKPSSNHLYGRYLATELSFNMAQYAVSERLRPLSCVGLLAVASESKCALWLVDSTGSYPVRAHCVGGGLQHGMTGTVADLVNERLSRIEFDSMKMDDGAKKLLEMLEGKLAKDDVQVDSDDRTLNSVLKAGARMEVAFVKYSNRRMIRGQLRTLLNLR